MACGWLCWNAHDCHAARDILGHHRAGTDDCVFTDTDSREYHGASTNESEIAHNHLACDVCPRGYVDAVSDNAVVVDGSRGVDDHDFPEC